MSICRNVVISNEAGSRAEVDANRTTRRNSERCSDGKAQKPDPAATASATNARCLPILKFQLGLTCATGNTSACVLEKCRMPVSCRSMADTGPLLTPLRLRSRDFRPLERREEHESRPEETCLYRLNARLDGSSRFPRSELLEISKDQDLPVLFRQSGKGAANGPRCLDAGQSLMRRFGRRSE